MTIKKLKGTNDIFGDEVRRWVRLEEIIRNVCKIYNYQEIRTPIFEESELFHRHNENSDMVKKETYDFIDRGNNHLTLRPEGTAGVVRSYIENKMYGDSSLSKLFYIGPMFRYERPQKGRCRQLHQFGVEALGSASPLLDAEVIALAVSILKALGIKKVCVKINNLGDEETRVIYREKLIEYFKNYTLELCEDCKKRLNDNPLRLLDCKICCHKPFFQNSPKIHTYLTEKAQNTFEQTLNSLKKMHIDFQIKDTLVRGLDYYTSLVFEIEAEIEGFGAQNVLAGGGRYDNLVAELGGPNTAACGFAFGMERLLLALEAEEQTIVSLPYIHLYAISIGENASIELCSLVNTWRLYGLIVEMDYQNRSLKSQFNQSERLCAKYLAILGEDELKQGVINIKDVELKTQETIKIEDVAKYIIHSIRNKQTNSSHCGKCKE